MENIDTKLKTEEEKRTQRAERFGELNSQQVTNKKNKKYKKIKNNKK